MWCKYLSLDSCIRCSQSDQIHQGKGLCIRCYSWTRRRKNNPNLKTKQFEWSENFEKCIECKDNTFKHQAHGLCIRCYARNNSLSRKAGFKPTESGWSLYYEKCIDCNSIDNKYESLGRCTKCYSKYRYKDPNYLRKKREYTAQKSKSDLQFRLKNTLRARLRQAIKTNQKTGSAVKDLGCSVEELKKHLESKFKPGMSWDNWAHDGWHIDHIIPLDSFDLSNREELLKAVHFTNLQPLWAKDNFSKNNQDALGVRRH